MWKIDLTSYLLYRINIIGKLEVDKMKDEKIIELFFQRLEKAIQETDKKYGNLCRNISYRILYNKRDSEEIVNDTWMVLWNHIPPKRPNNFKAFICRITKNLSLKKYEYEHAKKRKSEYEVSINELSDCIMAKNNVENNILQKELAEVINRFLESLPKEKRMLFLKRYWFMKPVKELAKEYHISQKTASMRLSRIRQQLKHYLQEEGYDYDK